MVKVLAFIEFLELDVPWLCLGHVGPDGQVFFIFLCDEIFEFLFHFYLSESLLEAVPFLSDEGGQVIRNFLIGVKGENVFWLMETLSQLLEKFDLAWDS